MIKEYTLHSPLDMHLHLRDNEMLKLTAPLTAKTFSGAVIMPNLVPPVTNEEMLDAYKNRVIKAAEDEKFIPYMTLFFTNYNETFLERIKNKIIGIKLYPAGITTNSEAGVKSIADADKTFSAMQNLGIPLLVHGETNGFVLDRETEFLDVYRSLAEKYPNLKIIMEHITTADAVNFLEKYSNVYATSTLHHLLITLDDVAGGALNPHLFCKPIAKRPEDRRALLDAALQAHPKLMFGSDSAPHPVSAKECPGCAAGVFTAPIALQLLIELFSGKSDMSKLQEFVSGNAVRVYGITPPDKKVVFEEKPFQIPSSFGNVVPMFAGKEISISIKEVL